MTYTIQWHTRINHLHHLHHPNLSNTASNIRNREVKSYLKVMCHPHPRQVHLRVPREILETLVIRTLRVQEGMQINPLVKVALANPREIRGPL